MSSSDKVVSVAHGFYALLPYACQYWMDHLQRWLEAKPKDSASDRMAIQAQVTSLAREITPEAHGGALESLPDEAEADRLRAQLHEFLPAESARIIHILSLRQHRGILPKTLSYRYTHYFAY